MPESEFRLGYAECLQLLADRLSEPAPGRIQLVAGPRQVGKTTMLLDLERRVGRGALYAACDAPEAALPGFWERLWNRGEALARGGRTAVLLLDEVQHAPSWAARLKADWDRLRRRGVPVHVVATGSSALRLGSGTRESLAGRFERVELVHWSAGALAETFGVTPRRAAEILVRQGAYPGAFELRRDARRWAAYVRDAIVEPAVGRDLLALAAVRRPGLLRQVFGVCASSPAEVLSLQKIQGQLQEPGALETVAHYLRLLEEAYLVAALEKHSPRVIRRRASPPKIAVLSNALLAVTDPRGAPDRDREPARFGAWVENACLAHAWNAGQRVAYWREEPLEVDGVLEGSWGKYAIEVKTGSFDARELRGLLEFCARFPDYRPLVVCEPAVAAAAGRAGVRAMDWRDFLVEGPSGD